MKRTLPVFAAISAVALLSGTLALYAQAPVPSKPTILNAGDLIPVTLGGQPSANQQYADVVTLAGYDASLPHKANIVIGGDATTNLFQRATSGASVTTTVTYGGPDRWAYWSGTNTAMTVSRDTTAGDLPTGVKQAFKMARTSGQTGVVQACMIQEVESANVYPFQGQTAELDFHAFTGANFSAASANMKAYIITGTGVDEGVAGSASVAFGLNAGGGGSGGWTGQANATAAAINLGAVSTMGRYAAVATIPTGATEIAVALCFTPVGTASTNDYIAFSNIQLVRNSSLASKVSATVGYSCDNQSNAQVQCSSYDRSRPAAVEAALQQRYFYKVTEGAALQTRALCVDSDVTHANCLLQFPVPMRIAPVFTGDGGFTAGFAAFTTTGYTTLGACTGLAVSTVLASTVASVNNVDLTCVATTIPAAGTANILMDNGGSGVIKASAEL